MGRLKSELKMSKIEITALNYLTTLKKKDFCSLLDRSNVVQVVLSEHNLAVEDGYEQVYNVSRIVLNPTYNSKTYNGDIMLLKVSTARDQHNSE